MEDGGHERLPTGGIRSHGHDRDVRHLGPFSGVALPEAGWEAREHLGVLLEAADAPDVARGVEHNHRI